MAKYTLEYGDIALRLIRRSDERAWDEVRRRNREWLRPWEATVPRGDRSVPRSFRAMVRGLRLQARNGTAVPMVVTVGGTFAGQVTMNGIVRGSAQTAQIGYWIDQRYAGRGVTPIAVALLIDHAFERLGLHRIEIAIRPENAASLRVVEKLQIPEVGFAPRYLHIDGDWADHRLFAITTEDVSGSVLGRYLQGLNG